MRYFGKSTLFLLCTLLFSQVLLGQKILADTTLKYSRFIDELESFKMKDKIDEIWVVEFWSSSNGRSMNEVEAINKFASKYKNKPIRFVYIATDRNRKGWLTQLSDRKMTGEHFIVSDTAYIGKLKRGFKHNAIPAIFTIDRTAQVRRMKNLDELEAMVTAEAPNLPNHAYGWTPPPVKETPPPPPTEEELLRGWVYHVVKKGESLFSIAHRYNMSITGLQTLNGLTTEEVYLGQKIKIRPDPTYHPEEASNQ